jgi:uncharacterized repeat protein (TIGR02543 family)
MLPIPISVGSTNIVADAVYLAPKYTVTYDGNGNTAGNAPDDSTIYIMNEKATILGPGNLEKNGYVFSGWKTDGVTPEESWKPDMERSMISNVVLFAQWEPNGGTGGGGGNSTGNATVNDSNNSGGPDEGFETPEPPITPEEPASPGSEIPEGAIIIVSFFMAAIAVFSYRKNEEAHEE